MVDTNDNGFYNDPEDMVFMDLNHDLNFGPDESKALKKGVTFKLKKSSLQTGFSISPGKNNFGGETVMVVKGSQRKL